MVTCLKITRSLKKWLLLAVYLLFYCQTGQSQNNKLIDDLGKTIYLGIVSKDSLTLAEKLPDQSVILEYLNLFAADSLTKQRFTDVSSQRSPRVRERMMKSLAVVYQNAESAGIDWDKTQYLGVEAEKRPDFKSNNIDAITVAIRFVFKDYEHTLKTKFIIVGEKIYIADRIRLLKVEYR